MMQTRIAQLREKGLVTIEIIITENQRHLRVFLTQTKQQAFGGMHLTILFVLAIAVAGFFHIEGEHSVQPHFDRRGRDHRVSKMHRSIGIGAVQTARTLEGGRVKIVTPIEYGAIVIALMRTAGHGTFKFLGLARSTHLFKQL